MTVLTRDVYQRSCPARVRRNPWVGRWIVVRLLGIAYLLSVTTFEFLVTLVRLSGAGALQLMPAILGVCFPTRRLLTRVGILSGIAAGLVTLYLSLPVVPHPLRMHGAVWSLMANFLTALILSRFTQPPSAATVRRIHGEVERFVYGGQ